MTNKQKKLIEDMNNCLDALLKLKFTVNAGFVTVSMSDFCNITSNLNFMKGIAHSLRELENDDDSI